MKKGDIVTINDYSWCTHINGRTRDCRKHYTVIETGCTFPLQDSQCECYRNDTVIKIVGGDEIVFIHGTFLRPVPPKHKVMTDIEHIGRATFGMVYEISDKLYKEIKKS